MKRMLFLFFAIICRLTGFTQSETPFFVNYTSESYHAHNRNFDVICDSCSRIYVANFEGLLYYDLAEWRIIHTPNVSRITKLYKDTSEKIWVGGYNVFGYLTASSNGELILNLLPTEDRSDFMGEIVSIRESGGSVEMQTFNGKTYQVVDNHLRKLDENNRLLAEKEEGRYLDGYKINQSIKLNNGYHLFATSGMGLIVRDKNGDNLYALSEENGLCSNNVNSITVDGKGSVWGATDQGVFCAKIPSVYTRFTASEGLKGEVLSIFNQDDKQYVGTLQGLFLKEGGRFKQIPAVTQACWQINKAPDGSLLVATGDGLFRLHSGKVRRMTDAHTLAVFPLGAKSCYTGELDGVYLNTISGSRNRIAPIEKARKFIQDKSGNLWAENIFGQIYRKEAGQDKFLPVTMNQENYENSYFSLVEVEDKLYLLSETGVWLWNNQNRKFMKSDKSWTDEYPQFTYSDNQGRLWLTDTDGKNIHTERHGDKDMDFWLHPLKERTIRAMNVSDQDIWLGGEFGLIHWTSIMADDVKYERKINVYIRSVVLDNDSVIWGGFNLQENLSPQCPTKRVRMNSDSRNISFTFSNDRISIIGSVEYSYRLKGYNEWSAWSTAYRADFINLWFGNYTFEVRSRDQFGRMTEVTSFDFLISLPFYLRWYSIVFYLLLFILLVVGIVHWRMERVLKEKLHLERIVEQRTSELKEQKEEVERKSENLEKALTDLGNAQNKLIRQEKMATVGSLTKGLIDRILNPMNYINNFSHLTQGLIKDISENLEDEKVNMNPDNYEDTVDVLDMIRSNLEKIEEHGMNTTRILKAMEEMLKNRSGNLRPIDLAAVCRKNFEMLNSYYTEDIKKYHIRTKMYEAQEFITMEADAELMSKTIMSLLSNSIYAVKKKAMQQPGYEPLINLSIEICEGRQIQIRVRDNGIGMEDTIIDKIFDPFFTTKTTGEAAGVGLYLSREIISNHNGTITAESRKNEYTEFAITLPIKQGESDSI